MTPDERQLLTGLFDRINNAANQPRDREAENFINDRLRSQSYAPYLLAQTVIVQEQALRAAAERIEQLEAQQRPGAAPQEETSFLGSIGKSLFGGGQPSGASQPRYAPQSAGYAAPQQPQAQGGPWGQQGNYPNQYATQQAQPQGGGFLKGALGAAAGVAGGVLAVDAIRGLFGGHNNPFGMASGMGGGIGGLGQPGGETIVNNYYDGEGGGGASRDLAADDARQDFLQDQSDDFASDGGGFDNGDDSSYA